MTTYRPPHYGNTHKPFVDPTPMPKDIPKVDELGVSSAPLKSASFYIGSFCKPYSEDFMLCKAEDQNPEHCLKEGRRVTRCAQEAITKIKAACLDQFTSHWKCLDRNNHGFEFCRKPERDLNACLFQKLVSLHFVVKKNPQKTMPSVSPVPNHSIQKRDPGHARRTDTDSREEEPDLRAHPTIINPP
ncbi:NADH dehydrogenase (Ubiquinone) 1 alpha subcomplex 8 [Puccinia sorghi]|uniref:NADH dehydrogenase (Ubiquinone) 1 alpha subcomplex 8 n=1 Tax=Puccinia sorghi TaxID=27349 RepID=A0A0L6VGU2_9BASI|nr:NADH dehydrogenase (Ubiquinone) 1 alpha subcomplex 8 [Puccinia sorghi]